MADPSSSKSSDVAEAASGAPPRSADALRSWSACSGVIEDED
eukprot:CAMPEP_0185319718 /NCGR_PEP_ID=MMETSP1363-20130426/52826_1 /TAXON_ID=38817 /ORGANISM="Gephyrocapsa oceanica, Strain RCC1303" /LENGTH=41 /DNA_ID= /DNA_START= /DNA_END= /DNA_ORIENTATION=